jgi:dolichol kinase
VYGRSEGFDHPIEAAIQIESRALAMELLQFLRDADRARGEFLATARTRAESLAHTAREVLQRGGTSDAAETGVRRIVDALGEHMPDEHASGDDLREQLARLCAPLRSVYEEFAAALRADSVQVPQLRPANFKRNVFHVFSASVAVAITLLVPAPIWLIPIAVTLTVMAWTMEIGRRIFPSWNEHLMALFKHVAHPHEAHRINSSTWYMTALLLLSCTLNPMVTAAGIAVLGVGDSAAAFFGRRFGRVKLVRGRTLEGTFAFVVAGTLAAFPVLYLVERAEFPSTVHAALGMAIAAALTGAIAELFSRSVDDNFSIPIAAGAGAWLASLALLA